MDKKKLERLERRVSRRDAQQAVRNIKKAKSENPFALNAEVGLYKPGHGLTKLGRIVKASKTLLTVEWESGETEYFGKAGQGFYGTVLESGEGKTARSGESWGTEEDPHLMIPSTEAKQRLAEEREEKAKREADRKAAVAARDADPAYQQRQADLKRYSEMLSGLGANIENGWNDQNDFRIELDGIKPDRMEKLVAAIQEALK